MLQPSWIGEAEAGVPGGAFGQGRGQHPGDDVVVVMNLDDLLAGVGPQVPPDVLDQTPPEGDGAARNTESSAAQSNPSPT